MSQSYDTAASSYASAQPTNAGQDYSFYDSDSEAYNHWNSEESSSFSLFGKDGLGAGDDDGAFKAIAWAFGGIVPAIIAIVIIAIIIAIIVELKSLSTAVVVAKERSVGWMDSIANAFNDVESERLLNKMFPGGFHQVVQSIETSYRKYRGLDGRATAKKAFKSKH